MRTSVRWIVPIAVAATITGGVAVSSAQADTTPDVPSRTPEQVLAAVAGAKVTALSGTVVTRTDLGLPSVDLSGVAGGHGGASATDAQGLITRFLSGRNTLRVWVDGETKQRVQLIDPLDELNVVRNGTQVWTYSARQNEVGKGTVPADAGRAGKASTPQPSDLTPAQMAQRALAAADPTTAVTLGTPERVAGRAAYALTLTPKTKGTLVDRIVIAVDADKSVPLQVEVFARGYGNPAIQTGFTSVDFSRPSADTFNFTPPKGAKVTQLGDGESRAPHSSSKSSGSAAPDPSMHQSMRPTIVGTGWAGIAEFPAHTPATASNTPGSAGTDAEADAKSLVEQLTKPVEGGRALRSRLLSVLVTDDGRVLVGAVPVEALVDAARR